MADWKADYLKRTDPRLYEEIYGRKARKAAARAPGAQKYHAVRTYICVACTLVWAPPAKPTACPVCDTAIGTGQSFPSKLEAAVYMELLLLVRSGEYRNLKRQASVELQGGGAATRIAWKLDFSLERVADGATVYVEAKGKEMPDYVLKLKIWRERRPAELWIFKGHHECPRRVEVIQPTKEGETRE
jgi:hypothetical protein